MYSYLCAFSAQLTLVTGPLSPNLSWISCDKIQEGSACVSSRHGFMENSAGHGHANGFVYLKIKDLV